jgi:hypothetical protein
MDLRALRAGLAAGVLSICAAGASAETDEIVRITDLAPDAADSLNGLRAAVVGGILYFVGDPGSGAALYRWNGVDAPEQVPDSQGTNPDELVAFDDRLFFQGGPSNDRELWEYDPAGPTIGEALDLRPSGNGLPQRFAVAAGHLCFAAYTDTLGIELHCWDGDGAPDVFDLASSSDSSYPDYLVAWGDLLAFVAQPDGEEVLMTYDGVGAPQEVVPDVGEPFLYPCCLSVVGDELTFQAEAEDFNFRVWTYDGIDPPTRVSTTFEPWGFQGPFRGRVVVDGEDPSAGVSPSELWRGTTAGLRRVDPGTVVVGGEGQVTANEGLYFSAYPSEDSNDTVLFKFCGAGPVEPAHPSFASFDLQLATARPIVFAGRVLVAADDDEFGEELWAVEPSHIFCDDFEAGDLASW